jgi:molybdenum cofactor synthesis domain-containing protein
VSRRVRAEAVIIGDEILSGKIRDTNTPLLIDELRVAGVELVRIVIVGDEPSAIAEEVERSSGRADHVFTSGGIGPTHDDRTIEGIALAFGLPVVHHPELEEMIRAKWGDRTNEAALKLAEVPEGARLLRAAGAFLPVVAIRNVFVLAGVPQIFAAGLEVVRGELRGTCICLQSLYLSSDETSIAAVLTRVAKELPEVKIGSYPRIGDPDHRVRVTVEGTDEDRVQAALASLLELLPPGSVLRIER